MNESEVRALLAAAMAYDNRKPGEANVAAWMEAANRGRWSFEDALEAVHQHHVTSTAFLMPAHITAIVRAKMRQPTPFAELEASQPASRETAGRFAALIRDTFAMPRGTRGQRRAQRRSAEDVAAREAARAELDALRERTEAES